MSTLKVDGIRSNSATSDAITLASDGTCTANITNNLSNRNLIINGAMNVAQRGTSSTTNGYGTVDRFRVAYGNTDEAPTQEQVDVASGTTPYTLGFRKAFKVTNGNQTSGAGTSDSTYMLYTIEAQDVVCSGWNSLSSSSNISLSFWVKSSVSQNFYGNLVSLDGTSQGYTYETGTLTANTWTKITKIIPGNSNIQIDNNNEGGLLLEFLIFRGTSQTGSVTLNQWRTYDSSVRNPDMTSTWYTTNDATFEITGVQLEVGSVATDFEHRSYAQELALCQRYLYVLVDQAGESTQRPVANLAGYTNSYLYGDIDLPVEMRTPPTIVSASGTNYFLLYGGGSTTAVFAPQVYSARQSTSVCELQVVGAATNIVAGAPYFLRTNNASAYVQFWAEL